MSENPQPKHKREPKPKLTDAERHRRFVDMAHEIGANEKHESFDKAFDSVVTHITPTRRRD